jgi:hypothetical protein
MRRLGGVRKVYLTEQVRYSCTLLNPTCILSPNRELLRPKVVLSRHMEGTSSFRNFFGGKCTLQSDLFLQKKTSAFDYVGMLCRVAER